MHTWSHAISSLAIARSALSATCLLAVAGGPSAALAQCPPSFSASTFTVGASPRKPVVGDFNSDGLLDFATSNFGSGTVSIRLQNPNIANSYLAANNFATGLNSSDALVKDVDGDGRDDLLVAYTINSVGPRLGVIKFNAAGVPQTPIVYVHTPQNALKLADVTGDGRDEIVSNCGCNGIAVATISPSGAVNVPTNVVLGVQTNNYELVDLNDDGILDLAIPDGSEARIRVALGLSATTPSYGPLTIVATPGNFGATLDRGDFNLDGRDDLVAAYGIQNRVQVLTSTTSGGLTLMPSVLAGAASRDVAAVDVNADGYLDAVVANATANSVTVHLGNGLGNLTTGYAFATGTGPQQITIADMNADGKPDILTANSSGSVTILLNTSQNFFFNINPLNTAVCPGGTSTAVLTAGAVTNVPGGITGYRWERLVGTTWTTIANGPLAGVGTLSGATTNTLTIAGVLGNAGDTVAQIRAVATNTCGSLPSTFASLSLIRQCGRADLGAQGGVVSPCGDGKLDNNDFAAFVTLFFEGNALADLGAQGGESMPDGLFDNNDFVAFVTLFFSSSCG
jgi:hypothetical protein